MKLLKRLVSLVLVGFICFSSIPVFAQNTINYDNSTPIKQMAKGTMINEKTNETFNLEPYDISEPQLVPSARNSGIEKSYMQETTFFIPSQEELAARAGGEAHDSTINTAASARVNVRVYYSEKNVEGNISRRIDRVEGDYNITDHTCWFYYADLGYIAEGIILGNNGSFTPYKYSESKMFVDSQWTGSTYIIPNRSDLWLYIGNDYRVHRGAFYGKIATSRGGGGWEIILPVDVP